MPYIWDDKGERDWKYIQIGQGFAVQVHKQGIVRIEHVESGEGVGFTIEPDTAEFIYEFFVESLKEKDANA